ncbi:MAG: hypothetical protein NVS9B1_20370 [Candidatus Dormibacteraceae bacterium]
MDLMDAPVRRRDRARELAGRYPDAAPAAVAVAVVLGMVLAAAAVFGQPALLLGGAVVAGFGITHLSGLDLNLEERFFFGAVIGAMATTAAAFPLASLLGLGGVAAWGGLAVAFGFGAAGFHRGRSVLAADLRDVASRWAKPPAEGGHPWPLLLVALICGGYALLLAVQAWQVRPDGLYAGEIGIWGDWAAHLSYAGSFAYGANFPPQFPIDPGHRLGYPFLVDFLAAEMVALGSSLTGSLALTSGFLGIAFAPVMYLAGVRLLGSRAAATIAVFVFVLGGGFGFIYFFSDIDASGLGVLAHLPREYTHITDKNYQWLNPVLANLVPQRSTLFGFSFVLISLAILFSARRRPGVAPFLFAGCLAGIAPAFHVHSYGTVVALAAFWAVLNPRREWIGFFLPALVLGLPVVLWLFPPHRDACAAAAHCLLGLPVQIGWLAAADGHSDNIAWFWLKNLGLFIPLLLVAQLWRGLLPNGFARHFAPVWLWFVVPNLVLFHPWDWDNNKFFVFWELLGALLVGALLAQIARRGREGAGLAIALGLVLGLAGALDLSRAADLKVSAIPFTDSKGVQVATWVRANTEPHAVFLVAPDHNQPVTALTGRTVVLGYPGWVWSYGLSDWQVKQAAVGDMLRGAPGTPAQLQAYGVDYVVLGPQERGSPINADPAYWQRSADLVYSNGEYSVYRVR